MLNEEIREKNSEPFQIKLVFFQNKVRNRIDKISFMVYHAIRSHVYLAHFLFIIARNLTIHDNTFSLNISINLAFSWTFIASQ